MFASKTSVVDDQLVGEEGSRVLHKLQGVVGNQVREVVSGVVVAVANLASIHVDPVDCRAIFINGIFIIY